MLNRYISETPALLSLLYELNLLPEQVSGLGSFSKRWRDCYMIA